MGGWEGGGVMGVEYVEQKRIHMDTQNECSKRKNNNR